ncbi:MAG: 3'-5' exonuclease [Promethearchaeota archaeon]
MSNYFDWEKSFESNVQTTKKINSLGILEDDFKELMSKWRQNNLEKEGHDDGNLIIVLDIETTALKPNSGIICEVGLCFLNLKTGNVDRIFDTICQEKKHIDPNAWIFKNSDLQYDEVINAPFIDDFKGVLQDLFDLKYPITAFNQKFDFGYLENRGFKIHEKFWDPMLKLMNILRIPGYYDRFKWPSVQEAWNFFFSDSDYIEKHRALDDAIHEAKIIHETYKLLKK